MYRVIKTDAKGNESDYGVYADSVDIYEIIPHNYKFNSLFYETSNTKTFYTKQEVILDENGRIL